MAEANRNSETHRPTFFGTLNLPTRLPLTVARRKRRYGHNCWGIIFSAGAFDNTVRATNLMNGEELWNHAIPFTAQGTPMTYLSPQGNQTLIVVVPVFNSTRGSGYGLFRLRKKILWRLYFCLSLTGKLGAIHYLKKPNKFVVNSSSRSWF